MNSCTTVAIRDPNYDLSKSGYTFRKDTRFRATIFVRALIIDPMWRLCESAYRMAGIANSSFPSRWNYIPLPNETAKLFIGEIPMSNKLTGYSDADALTAPDGPNIKAVLCMTEGFENHSDGYLFKAITPQDWKARKVTFLQLETPDFEGINADKIERAVKFIDEQLQSGNDTYVQCKAGMSRSVAVVLSYMLIHYSRFFPELDDALNYLKRYRSQAYLEPQKIVDITKFIIERRTTYI